MSQNKVLRQKNKITCLQIKDKILVSARTEMLIFMLETLNLCSVLAEAREELQHELFIVQI